MAYTGFISHSNHPDDIAIVNAIVSHNRAREFEFYVAEKDLRPGRALKDKILQSIRSSDCIVLICSVHSSQSQVVSWEIGVADSIGKLVIPLLVEGTPPPDYFFAREYIVVSPGNPGLDYGSLSQAMNKMREGRNLGRGLLAGALGLLVWASSEDDGPPEL